jgi:hypothetical protein
MFAGEVLDIATRRRLRTHQASEEAQRDPVVGLRFGKPRACAAAGIGNQARLAVRLRPAAPLRGARRMATVRQATPDLLISCLGRYAAPETPVVDNTNRKSQWESAAPSRYVRESEPFVSRVL